MNPNPYAVTSTAKPASLAPSSSRKERLADVEDRAEQERGARRHEDHPESGMPAVATSPSRASRNRDGRGPSRSPTGGASPKRRLASARRGQRERDCVRGEDRLRPPTSSTAAAIAGPAMNPKSAIAPNSEVAAGSRRSSTRLGRDARGGGGEQPGANSREQGEQERPDKSVDDDEAEERDCPQHVGEDRASSARPAVRKGAEQRTEQHRRHHVGEQDQADRPRRVEAVQRDEQQRDVGRPRTERRLGERGEEDPCPPLMPKKFDY